MEIRQVDLFDDKELELFHEVTERAVSYQRPHHSSQSLDEVKLEFRQQDPTERGEAWVADDQGEVVAGLSLWFPQMDNLSKSWGSLGVDPDHRRRGIGSALVRHVVTRMRQDNRATFLTETYYPFGQREDHPYRRFAQDHGFTVALDEILRILPLPIDPALLQSLVDEAAPYHSGYRIESFVDGLPDDLLASYCHVRNRLGVEAPTGDVEFEPESMTPQIFLEKVSKDNEIGRTLLVTVAVDKSDAVVAYTEMALSPAPNQDVWQWGTLVHREHRGHRLGLALKASNLQRLAQLAPARERVLTCNAETNHHMVDINESLGFQAVEVVPMLELKLPPEPLPTEPR